VTFLSDYAIVGASRKDLGSNSNQGGAYIYHRVSTSWIEQEILTASDGADSDQFGSSVDLTEDYAVVGAYYKQISTVIPGEAYIFHRSGTTWTEQTTLIASDATDNDIRSELEKTHWWGRAYITTEEFTRDTYKEYLVRMKNSTTVETEKQFNSNRVNDRKSWFCHWGNDGVRYNVRCLDGGAWDRSSNKGFFDNLDDALILAREINIENDTLIGEES